MILVKEEERRRDQVCFFERKRTKEYLELPTGKQFFHKIELKKFTEQHLSFLKLIFFEQSFICCCLLHNCCCLSFCFKKVRLCFHIKNAFLLLLLFIRSFGNSKPPTIQHPSMLDAQQVSLITIIPLCYI